MLNESLVTKSEKKIYDFLPHEPETMAATLFIIGMAVYYLWRMFAITPQYDELYTYYTFISRGPLYSAIHWPLPNNHVGYSVISAIFNYFGNPYFGLRGVSYLCAVSNLILIYRICKKYFAHGIPLAAVILYSSMQVVNEYSVQGRGYTLATTCFLLSVYIIGKICRVGAKNSFLYSSLCGVLVIGLYTVPSSIYWVVPVGLSGVIYLFINAYRSRRVYPSFSDNIYYKKLINLLVSGAAAAFITFVLYALIWLAIGSNLLVKTEGSIFFGWTHKLVLLRAPFSAMKTGMEYMLSQPYIQSLSVDEFRNRYLGWVWSMFAYMLPGLETIVFAIVILSIIFLVYECIRHFEYSRTLINLMVIVNILFLCVILVAQRKLPYLRVFSYSCFLVTLCVLSVMERCINLAVRLYNKRPAAAAEKAADSHIETEHLVKTDKWYDDIGVYIPLATIVFIFIVRFFGGNFSNQLGYRENEVFNTLYIADVTKKKNPAVLDCDQQYLMKFGWDIDCQKTDVTDADMVIVDKDMLTSGYSGEDFWKFYQTFETIDWEYLKTMHVLYENEDFILYVK